MTAGSPLPHAITARLPAGANALNGRPQRLHERLLDMVPVVDRIACALYDA